MPEVGRTEDHCVCTRSCDVTAAFGCPVGVKLRLQKHGLMHDLLTGRVRVKVTESEAA